LRRIKRNRRGASEDPSKEREHIINMYIHNGPSGRGNTRKVSTQK